MKLKCWMWKKKKKIFTSWVNRFHLFFLLNLPTSPPVARRVWDLAETDTWLKLLDVFSWKDFNSHFILNPLLNQNYQVHTCDGRNSTWERSRYFFFLPFERRLPDLLPSFLPIPQSFRRKREMSGNANPVNLPSSFLSHLTQLRNFPIWIKYPSFTPSNKGLHIPNASKGC